MSMHYRLCWFQHKEGSLRHGHGCPKASRGKKILVKEMKQHWESFKAHARVLSELSHHQSEDTMQSKCSLVLEFLYFQCFTKLCSYCERLVVYLSSDMLYPFLRTSNRESIKGSHLPHPQKAVGNERTAAAYKKTLPAYAVITRWHNGYNWEFGWVWN